MVINFKCVLDLIKSCYMTVTGIANVSRRGLKDSFVHYYSMELGNKKLLNHSIVTRDQSVHDY